MAKVRAVTFWLADDELPPNCQVPLDDLPSGAIVRFGNLVNDEVFESEAPSDE